MVVYKIYDLQGFLKMDLLILIFYVLYKGKQRDWGIGCNSINIGRLFFVNSWFRYIYYRDL